MILGNYDISGMYDEVAHAFVRSGISQSRRHVDLLANKPRSDVDLETNLPQEIAISAPIFPACFATPLISATKTELLGQMKAIKDTFISTQNELRLKIEELQSHQAQLAAEQEAIIMARMRNLREQLLSKHKTCTSIKPTVMGDVSKTDAMKILVLKEARRQQKIIKALERDAKVSREQPLQEKLIAAGVLAKDAPLTLKIMQNHAKSLHL